ncbi:MAG: TlpA family protein disulfide reductase, partial [Muribaculaceae bacterium]|nr:TlpA family protein disulfide reductase [Muribaculaceae bacterium]
SGSYRPTILNGRKYIKNKGLGDCVNFLPNEIYTIDCVTPNLKEIVLVRNLDKIESETLSKQVKVTLNTYIEEAKKQRKLLLIDLWGTWCNPCVEAMPRLKAIEEEFRNKIMGMTICVDDARNKSLADSILDKNEIQGFRLFVSHNDNLIKQLDIPSFPTYFIVNGDGDILIKGKSTSCLDIIEDYLRNL